MSDRSQIQYQPITGPVWRAPVAESLAWLPEGQQPARQLEYRRLGDFQQPPFVALYVPSGLEWQPIDRYFGRPLGAARIDLSVYPIQVGAPAYDPSTLEWISSGRYPVPVERRILGTFVQPPFQALYDPSKLQWQAQDRYYGKPLARASWDWITGALEVEPSSFDPATMEWALRGRHNPVIPERRILGDFQQPQFQALYKPEGMQWTLQGRYPQVPIENRKLGDFQQPNFTALFKPEGLQWEPSDRYAGKPIAYSLRGSFVIDPPFQPPAAPYDPSLLMWVPMGRAYPQPQIERRMLGDFQQPPFDTSSPIPPTPPVITEIPAGRRRYRDIYRVRVDGHPFEFRDLASAIAFLNEAKDAAEQLALQAIANAAKRQAASAKKVEPPSIPMPKIEVSSRDLRGAVTATKREIAEIYDKAMRDCEIAILLEMAIKQREDEEIIFWL